VEQVGLVGDAEHTGRLRALSRHADLAARVVLQLLGGAATVA
jgi:hypothetical protein